MRKNYAFQLVKTSSSLTHRSKHTARPRDLPRRSLLRVVVWGVGLPLGLAASVNGQTWTNTSSGNWSVAANWSPSGAPTSSSTGAQIFAGSTSYTATLNIGTTTFVTNSLTFNNTDTAGTGVTIALSGPPSITLGASGTTPLFTQSGTGKVNINSTLLLLDAVVGNTTEFTGTGTGDVSITEARFNVNNSPIIKFTGSYNTLLGSFYKQQGNKTLLNNTASGKTVTVGTINLQTTNANNTLTFDGTGDTVVTGSIFATNTGSNGGTITKTGIGTLTLSGNNTYTGLTTVSNGTLNITNVSAGANLGSATTAVVLGAAATEGVLNYGGASASYTRGFTVNAGGGRINTTSAGQTLTIATGTITGSGTLKVGGAGDTIVSSNLNNGSGGLTNLDAGTVTLTGTNTYAGTTNVLGGTLIQGAPTAFGGSNTFNVASGAVLDATNSGIALTGGLTAGRSSGFANDVLGNVTLDTGAILTVGGNGTAGTYTHSGNLSFNSGAALKFDLNNSLTAGNGVNDLVAVSGNLSLTGSINVTLNALGGPLSPGSYTLFTYGGTLAGTAANLAAPTGLAPGRSTYAYDTTTTPGKVLLNVTGAAANLTWVGNGTTNPWDNTTTGVFTGGSPDNFFDGDIVNFTNSGAANGVVNLTGTLQPFTANVNSTSNYTFAGAGTIAGPAVINKSGTGSLTIQTSNTYTGATNVLGGTLVVAINDALGAATAPTIVSSGAQLLLSGGISTPEPISLNGTGIGNAGALQNSGFNTVTGTVTIQTDALITNADTTNPLTIEVSTGTAIAGSGTNVTFGGAGNTVVNGAISLGAGNLVKNGSGKLTFGGSTASTGTGTYIVNAGTLELGKTTTINAIPAGLAIGDGTSPATVKLLVAEQISNTSAVTVNNNSILDLNGFAETVGNLAGTGTITSATATTLTATTANFGGVISGALSLTKANASILRLTGTANTFSGTLAVNNGTLEVVSLADTGAGSNGTGPIKILNGTNAAATLRYIGSGATITRSIDIIGTTGAGSAILDSSGTGPLVWNGGVSLSASTVTKTLSLRGTNTADNVFGGLLANGTGILALEKADSGTWVLTNSGNTFTGNVSVINGTLKVTNSGAIGVGPKTVAIGNAARPSLLLDGSAGNLTFGSNITFTASSDGTIATPGAIVNFAGNNVINGVVSLVNGGGGDGRLTVSGGSLTLAGTINADGATGVRTLLIGGTGPGTITGVIADGITGSNTRVVSVQKDGTGTWIVNGANTFTGGVAVQAGTLQVNALAPTGTAQPLGQATSAVTLGAASTAGTLEYTGTTAATLARPITVAGVGGGIVKNSSGQLLTLSGAVTTSAQPLTLTGAPFNVTGVITGATAGSTLIIDSTTATLSAANTFNGTTSIQGGSILKNGIADALPATNTLVLGGATGNTPGTYDLAGFNQTLTSLNGAGTGPKTVTNSGTTNAILTITGDGNFGGVIQNGGTNNISIVKTTGGTLVLSGANTYTGSTTVTGGTLDASAGSITSSAGPLAVTGAGSQLIAKKVIVSAATVGVDAKVTLTNVDTQADLTGRSSVGTWDNSGLVDVGKTGIVIATATEATIQAQIIAGRNATVGGPPTWTGTTGITSSNAAANPSSRAVGYFVAGAQITVAQTVVGDTNLDGVSNIDDLSALAQNYNLTGKNWQTGDFNYDGTVNIDDLSLLAQNYNLTAGDVVAPPASNSPAFPADFAAAFGGAAVPEPASAGLAGLACFGLIAGRRRRHA